MAALTKVAASTGLDTERVGACGAGDGVGRGTSTITRVSGLFLVVCGSSATMRNSLRPLRNGTVALHAPALVAVAFTGPSGPVMVTLAPGDALPVRVVVSASMVASAVAG